MDQHELLNEEHVDYDIDLEKPFKLQLEVIRSKKKRIVRSDDDYPEFLTIIDGPTRLKALTRFQDGDTVVMIRSNRRSKLIVKGGKKDYMMWHRHTYIVNPANGFFETW